MACNGLKVALNCFDFCGGEVRRGFATTDAPALYPNISASDRNRYYATATR